MPEQSFYVYAIPYPTSPEPRHRERLRHAIAGEPPPHLLTRSPQGADLQPGYWALLVWQGEAQAQLDRYVGLEGERAPGQSTGLFARIWAPPMAEPSGSALEGFQDDLAQLWLELLAGCDRIQGWQYAPIEARTLPLAAEQRVLSAVPNGNAWQLDGP
ncbi:MAG: hypothetical protein BRC58_07505 [Cyanobacteria bacterium QS_8_64_29]|nr:MAG: hypothetical protein BRC58_07505 [Cyanobacteria bacterium QS_8_64_29]